LNLIINNRAEYVESETPQGQSDSLPKPSLVTLPGISAQSTSLVKKKGDSRPELNRDIMAVCNILS
jgi:hypothetical protein